MDSPTPATLRRMTAAQLAEGDGKDGRPALVGYKGRVYDCSSSKLWRNGRHVNKHLAGTDLTAEMADAPHMDDVMARFPVVGELVPDPLPAALARFNEAPPLIAWLLGKHPHPIAVHYPIAMGLFASLFTAAQIVGETAGLDMNALHPLDLIAYWMLLISTLTAFPATLTGLLSWWFNYQGVLNWIYRWKIALSIALAVTSVAAVALRIAVIPGPFTSVYEVDRHAWYIAYIVLLLAQGPLVLALGWFGGKITYPD